MDHQTFAYIQRLGEAGIAGLDVVLATEELRTLNTDTVTTYLVGDGFPHAAPAHRVAAMNVLHDRALAERDGVHTLDAPVYSSYVDLSRRYAPTCSCGKHLGETKHYGTVKTAFAAHLSAVAAQSV